MRDKRCSYKWETREYINGETREYNKIKERQDEQ